MITNKNNLIKKKKSPLLAKIKFELTFFQILWRFAFSLPLSGEPDGRFSNWRRGRDSNPG